MPKAWFVGMLILISGVGACGKAGPNSSPQQASTQKAGTVRVFVSILPQAYFVERVGGRHVIVDVLVGPGQSPTTYSVTPRQMADLEKADVFFSIGVPFERQLMEKIAERLPDLDVVDCRKGIQLRMMSAGHHHAEDEADGDEHGAHATEPAGTPDPHVWLSPRCAKQIALNVCDGLCRLDAGHAAEYRANLAGLQADLDAVDARIARALAPLKGREFFVYHPAYGYFGDEYGLRQVAVEIEGKDPGPQQVARLIEKARAANVRVIFVQPQFPRDSARVIAREIGGVVVPLDPLARDYLKNLEDMASKLADALGAERP